MRKLAVAMAALLAACGADSVSLNDYSDAAHDGFCRNFVKCGAVKDVATCQKLDIGLRIRFSASGVAAFDMGKAVFAGDKAQACFDAIADASCDSTSESQRSAPAACLQIVTGTLHAGERCTLDAECRSQFCDVPACNMACCAGTCVGDTTPALAKVGESCAVVNCEASYCTSALTCAALKPANAPCAAQSECQFGLACVTSGTTTTCIALPKPGEACAGLCTDYGTTCNPTSRTCVKVALAGDACTTDADCSFLYGCDAGGHCSAGVALGAACAAGDHCADDSAFCDAPRAGTGTCTLPKADGMPCQNNEQCESFACDTASLRCIPEPVCI